MISAVNNLLQSASRHPLMTGLLVLLINVGGRYVDLKLSKAQVAFLKGSFLREVFIFALVLMATKDLVTSFLLTAAFIILANYLFNERSNLCILPPKYKDISRILDRNEDGFITDEEIEQAHRLLKRADDQKKKINQSQAISFLSMQS